MEMVMTKGFNELNEKELMVLDGGFDLGEFATGLYDAFAGAIESVGGVALAMAGGIPVGAVMVIDGFNRASQGWNAVFDSFKD